MPTCFALKRPPLVERGQLHWVIGGVRGCETEVSRNARRQWARQHSPYDGRVVGLLIAIWIDREQHDEDLVVFSELRAR